MSRRSRKKIDRCHDNRQKLLDRYKHKETQEHYKTLAKFTAEECEQLLDRNSIKGVVQRRAKGYSSLEKKLEEMKKDRNFRRSAYKENSIYEHPDMGDLAGVRVGLYLPGDVLKIADKISTHFHIVHCFGTVTGGRSTGNSENQDLQKHGNGPWTSKDKEGNDESWEHYGYKSWQLVIELKGEIKERLPQEVSNSISTLPEDIASTPTMKRMIDATNGLAITTEIMLEELERSVDLAKQEAKELDWRPFKDGPEFSSWFAKEFKKGMTGDERKKWTEHKDSDKFLIGLCASSNRDEVSPPCRARFRSIIQRHKLLKQKGNEKNIAHLILDAVGFDKEIVKKGLPGQEQKGHSAPTKGKAGQERDPKDLRYQMYGPTKPGKHPRRFYPDGYDAEPDILQKRNNQVSMTKENK
ncbi:ankyrin repeat-containing protein [Fusarium mexicanum]|uniref:Ankyrin repeat-containing protein n=1 Tax=Fusarium mexicanum TaxID=751941 RepID=A0A8H5IKS9_9HYPO|nr:ankyrin repeat-containing protein [Fusarium mexicanum]